ncbi:XrtX-associated membrane protein [Hymenobacter jeollabukensis]|uniref:Uncharacterized protein n=1 Tax=Hymenobacter jeollabukensis TaxID=2025313 RepID=A0A5R8WSV3_9BACT|nr:hypothetical protein [Hymenobacter jeollabukensis]TLM94263.1 hypothetical protein FDY95_09655 [Hymenobacter jeollabukensis]
MPLEPTRGALPWRVRLPLAALLAALLFWAGTYDVAVFAWLTAGWQRLLEAIGLSPLAQRIQQGISGDVTTRSLPAMLTYGLAYTSICLLILALLIPRRAMRTAAGLYLGVFALSALLLLGGKAAGDVRWAYQLGRRLIDFIVSPLPVIALVPLLRWHYAPPRTSPVAPIEL